MTTTRYYRATCGSTYRVTETTARPATKTTRAVAASTLQARRSTHSTSFRRPLRGRLPNHPRRSRPLSGHRLLCRSPRPMKPVTQTPLDFGTLTAEQITRAILGYLHAHGFSAWAQPNRGEYDPKTNKWRPHPNSRRGVPDILGFRRSDGKFIGVEVKACTDRPRPEQTEFLNELKAAGGLAFIAYDFARFQQSFEGRGLHLQHRHD